jgi:tetratricopeptide (TPR) repeat protein/O-antigen ligase
MNRDHSRFSRSDLSSKLAFLALLTGLAVALVAGGLIWRADFSVQVTALLAAAVLAAVWWVWRGPIGRAALPHLSFDLALAAAGCVLLGLWAISSDPRVGLGRISTLFAYLILFYVLLDVFDFSPTVRRAGLMALLTLTGFVLFAALLEVYVIYSQWWQAAGGPFTRPPFPYRLVSLVGHSNSFMGLVNLSAPLAVVTLLSARRRSARVAATAWLLCYLGVFAFTSSRGGWLGAAAWMIVLVGLWIWKLRGLQSAPVQALARAVRMPGTRRLKPWLYAAIPVVLAAVFYAVYRFYLAFAAHPSHGGSLTGGREGIWSTALAIWRASPVFGSGPGRFAYEYVTQSASLPPGFWALHAHGLVFTILGEFGLVGLAVFLLSAVWAGIWIVRRVFAAAPDRLPLALAALAGIAGWLAQMIFDDQTAVPAVMVPLVLVLAWACTCGPSALDRRKRLPIAWLGLPILLVMAGAVWSLWAYFPLAQALAGGSQGTGAEASTAQAMAVSAQRDPGLPYYWVESGLAWADAWGRSGAPASGSADELNKANDLSSAHELDSARSAFRQAIEREPALSWNAADLAILDGLAGDPAAAVSGLEKVTQQAPSEPVYRLNLAYWYERSGDLEHARQAYTRTLDLSPTWASHPFWSLNPFRASILSAWQGANPEKTRNVYSYERASAALQAKDEAGARRWLAESEWLEEPAAGRGLVRAELAQTDAERTARLEDVLSASVHARQYWFSNLTNTYTLWLYDRRGLADMLVPGTLLLEPDYGQYAAFDRLAASYRASGDCANASRVWDQTQRLIHGGAIESIDPAPECK